MAEVSAIIKSLDAGKSVALVGLPSIGKSNLLKFLDQARLPLDDPNSPWRRYAPHSQERGPLVSVMIDPNALLPALPDDRGKIAARSWPGFELVAHRTALTRALFPVDRTPPDRATDPRLAEKLERIQDKFTGGHPGIVSVEDGLHGHLALRHLERMIEAALEGAELQNRPIRIVYFFDEFERMLATMPDYFFVALRSIRDRFKESVMFAVFLRNTLPYLIDEARMVSLEPFVELFHDNTVYLRPFGDDDAWRMIEDLEKRTVSKDDHALGLLIRATGGFAGLLRAGFEHADKLAAIHADNYQEEVRLAATRLAAEVNVQQECKTLLRGLNDHEIRAIYATTGSQPVKVAPGSPSPEDTVRELIAKSLLVQTTSASGGLAIAPPILAAYIRTHPAPPPERPAAPPVTLPS